MRNLPSHMRRIAHVLGTVPPVGFEPTCPAGGGFRGRCVYRSTTGAPYQGLGTALGTSLDSASRPCPDQCDGSVELRTRDEWHDLGASARGLCRPYFPVSSPTRCNDLISEWDAARMRSPGLHLKQVEDVGKETDGPHFPGNCAGASLKPTGWSTRFLGPPCNLPGCGAAERRARPQPRTIV